MILRDILHIDTEREASPKATTRWEGMGYDPKIRWVFIEWLGSSVLCDIYSCNLNTLTAFPPMTSSVSFTPNTLFTASAFVLTDNHSFSPSSNGGKNG